MLLLQLLKLNPAAVTPQGATLRLLGIGQIPVRGLLVHINVSKRQQFRKGQGENWVLTGSPTSATLREGPGVATSSEVDYPALAGKLGGRPCGRQIRITVSLFLQARLPVT